MQRLLLSAALIFGVAASVAFSTRAVFSDTDSFDGNTIATATVNIDAREEGNASTLAKPIVSTNLVPGEYTDWFRGVIFNQADSTNVRVWMHVDNVVGEACDKINLRVRTGNAGGDETQYGIYSGTLADITGEANRKEVTGDIFDAPDYLPANWSLVLMQRAQLDDTADNTYQNKGCTWDEVFVAENVAP